MRPKLSFSASPGVKVRRLPRRHPPPCRNSTTGAGDAATGDGRCRSSERGRNPCSSAKTRSRRTMAPEGSVNELEVRAEDGAVLLAGGAHLVERRDVDVGRRRDAGLRAGGAERVEEPAESGGARAEDAGLGLDAERVD